VRYDFETVKPFIVRDRIELLFESDCDLRSAFAHNGSSCSLEAAKRGTVPTLLLVSLQNLRHLEALSFFRKGPI